MSARNEKLKANAHLFDTVMCMFEEGGQEYNYLALKGTVSVGQMVVVNTAGAFKCVKAHTVSVAPLELFDAPWDLAIIVDVVNDASWIKLEGQL